LSDLEETCPYCGNVLERGAIISGYPIWWFVNPRKTRWRIKANSREKIGSIFSGTRRYGFKCHQCNLLIIDLIDPKEIKIQKG